jgi:hypothetical protein
MNKQKKESSGKEDMSVQFKRYCPVKKKERDNEGYQSTRLDFVHNC